MDGDINHDRRPTIPFAHTSRRKPRRWPLILRFNKGAIHGHIVIPVTLHALFAALICYLDSATDRSVGVPESIIPSLSIVVGLILVFRNQTCYNRFWEGRDHLTDIITSIRNLVRAFLVNSSKTDSGNHVASAADRVSTERVINILIAILYSTKDHLRAGWGAGVIAGSAIVHTLDNAHSSQNVRSQHEECGPSDYSKLLPDNMTRLDDLGLPLPLQLTFQVEQYIRRGFDKGWFAAPQEAWMHQQLSLLVLAYGKMETIRLTPIPVAHLIHQKQVLALFGCVMPFAMVNPMGWWAVPISTLVNFTLYGIEGIGSQLEDPFGCDRNDIKMDAICEDIATEVSVMLEEWQRAAAKGGDMFLENKGEIVRPPRGRGLKNYRSVSFLDV